MAFFRVLLSGCLFAAAHGISVMMQAKLPSAGAPDLADVEKQLGAVNDTMDKVADVVDTVNTTAYGMLDTLLSSTADFESVLATLQKAVDALGSLPFSSGDDSDITAAATKFIGLANTSLQKAQGELPQVLSKVSSQIDAILPQIQAIANQLIDQFMDAAQEVQGLSNLTDSASFKQNKKSGHDGKAAKALRRHSKGKNKGKHDVMALLEQHATQSQGAATVSSVDRSVSQKGGGGNACSKASGMITKANATLLKMSGKIQEVNATGGALLLQVLDTATTGLSALNSTVATGLAAAEAVPSKLLDPITKGLDTVLSTSDELTSTVQDKVSTIESMVADADTTLATLFGLSDTLEAAVTEAECAGACGAPPDTC